MEKEQNLKPLAAWTEEDTIQAAAYGVCLVCGRPRIVNRELLEGETIVYLTGPVCPEGCDKPCMKPVGPFWVPTTCSLPVNHKGACRND